MNYKCLSKDDQITSHWSGGTTTQLYIYPEETDYKKQNFKFRISSAKVEVEESVFTKLEGIQRQLMILRGELKIAHKDHHVKYLKPFEVDSFMGSWETKAKGCVTDFNLMLSADMEGRLEHVHLDDQQVYRMACENSQFLGLYVWKGSICLDEADLQMQKGDFVIFDLNEGDVVPKVIATEKKTDMILSYITHKEWGVKSKRGCSI